MLIPINITGSVSKNRANSLSNQQTFGFYPEATKEGFVLRSFPGLKHFALGNGYCRGADVRENFIYHVQGSKLYSINVSGTVTLIGNIPGTSRCIFSGIGDNVVIVSDGIVNYWNGVTLSIATDIDFETPNSATHLNNRVIYDGDGGRWACSDVGNAISINALNYSTAESHFDSLVRVYAYDQILYLFGTRTIEPHWDSGVGRPPYERMQQIIQVGLGALHSVVSNDNGIYFLGDDKNFYFLKGTSYQRVSTIPIATEISAFDGVSDCEANAFTYQGQNFISFTFPGANRTFVLNESVGVESGWFELSASNDIGTKKRYIGSSFLFFDGKTLVTDSANGNIYELSTNVYQDANLEVLRLRDTATFHGGMIGKPGKLITMSRFELLMETGVGTDSIPYVVLQVSDDGGRTFSNEMWSSAGKAGEFIWKVEWLGLGSFYNRILRVKTSGNFFWSIHSAAADISVGL